MELREYLRLLRRGWLAIALVTLLSVGSAVAYLAIAPKRFEVTSVILLAVNNPQTIGDAQQGIQLAQASAATVADIIESPAVLDSVADRLEGSVTLDELLAMVTAVAREQTAVIDIAVAGSDAALVTEIANLTATSAANIVPELQSDANLDTVSQLRVEQIRRATVPGAPISPDTAGVLLIGIIVGLALGVAIAVVRGVVDGRLSTTEDLRRLNEIPVLSVIPRRKRARGHEFEVGEDPLGSYGDGFRTLRANLSYLQSSDRRSFVLAPVGYQADGVSVAVELAWSLAEAGRKTIVVDADLRRSVVGDALRIPEGPGLADVLAGLSELSDVVRPTRHPSLDVVLAGNNLRAILAGNSQRNPSDLLSSPGMESVIRELEKVYDDVIVHTPSLRAHTDAAVTARVASWTIVVVAAGRSRASDVTEALDALERVRVVPIGVVLAGARAETRR